MCQRDIYEWNRWVVEPWSHFRLTLKNSFATFVLYVSSPNARKVINNNILGVFSQTIYKGLANCSCSLKHNFVSCVRILFARQTKITISNYDVKWVSSKDQYKDGTPVRWVFEESIKTPETVSFSWLVFTSRPNENWSANGTGVAQLVRARPLKLEIPVRSSLTLSSFWLSSAPCSFSFKYRKTEHWQEDVWCAPRATNLSVSYTVTDCPRQRKLLYFLCRSTTKQCSLYLLNLRAHLEALH